MNFIYLVLFSVALASVTASFEHDLEEGVPHVEIQFPPAHDDDETTLHATPSVINNHDEDLGTITQPVAPVNPFIKFLKAQAEERERHQLEMPAVAITPFPSLFKNAPTEKADNPFTKFLRMQHEEKKAEAPVNPFAPLLNSLRRLRAATQRMRNGGLHEDPAHMSSMSRSVDDDDATPEVIMPTFPNLGRMFRNIFEQKLESEYEPIFTRTFQIGNGGDNVGVVTIRSSFAPLAMDTPLDEQEPHAASPLPLIFQKVAEGLKGFRNRLRQILQKGEREIKERQAREAKEAAAAAPAVLPARSQLEVQAAAQQRAAQEAEDKAHPCRADARKLCADKLSVSRLATLLCLNVHQPQLSDACKAKVQDCPAFQCSGDVARLCPSAANHQQVAECLHLNAAKLSKACVRSVKKHKKKEVKTVAKQARAMLQFRPAGALGQARGGEGAMHVLANRVLPLAGAEAEAGKPAFRLFGVLPPASAAILAVGVVFLLAVAVCMHAQSRRQQKTELAKAEAAAPVTDVETLVGETRVERNNSGFEGGSAVADAPNAIVIN